MWVFMFVLMFIYLAATEYITASKSKGEVLVFRRGHKLPGPTSKSTDDLEAAAPARSVAVQNDNSDNIAIIERQTAIFQWRNVCYDIKIKKEERRILDHVDGWVKPGTLTALMGVSGAGKTTLLDVLATRTTMGVISGDMLVDGKPRDDSFQRKTGRSPCEKHVSKSLANLTRLRTTTGPAFVYHDSSRSPDIFRSPSSTCPRIPSRED